MASIFQEKRLFLYLITNTIDGKKYIGQTKTSLRKRWMCHCKNKSVKNVLANAIRKHGCENFTIESLLEIDDHDLLNEFEKEYIIRYCTRKPNGYNILPGGATTAQWKLTDETKIKIASAALGRKHSEEWNRNIRAGLIASRAAEKSSIANKGKRKSTETRLKMSLGQKSIPRVGSSLPEYWTPERKQEHSELLRRIRAERARLGIPFPKRTGWHFTPEQRKKISESHKRTNAKRRAERLTLQTQDICN